MLARKCYWTERISIRLVVGVMESEIHMGRLATTDIGLLACEPSFFSITLPTEYPFVILKSLVLEIPA
jgi:hypothetical protein